MARPVRELKAFAKVDLEPGETTAVDFPLDRPRPLLLVDRLHGWVLEGGEFTLAVGASSRDLRLTTTVDIAAPPLPVRLDAMSTLQEWLADPTGPRCCTGGRDRRDGRPRGILGDDELIASSATSRSAPWPASPASVSPTILSTAWSSRSPRETDSDLGAIQGDRSRKKNQAWDLPVDNTTSKGMSDRDDERRAETPVQPTQRPEPDAG